MSDAPNPQLTPAWTVQNQGGPNASVNANRLDLVASEGSGLGGGDAGSGVTPAASQAAVAASTASTVAGVDTDLNTLITAYNALVAALKTAGLMVSP
jgi:hypothetical protein